ncbi:MAG: hypothetical protein CMH58_10420 [Myxococcales bacterium]|nr:hypothetical protein [Myxococcales bacterium]|tara:strand:+ start:2713 stop:3309 length:597 start_codon:yes stop_codon:yes gene_type:complete
MKKGIELIILPIIAFVVYTKPSVLVEFSGTVIGKLVMVAIVMAAASRNPLYGVVSASLMVFLLESNYEEGFVPDVTKIVKDAMEKQDVEDSVDSITKVDEEVDEEVDEDADVKASEEPIKEENKEADDDDKDVDEDVSDEVTEDVGEDAKNDMSTSETEPFISGLLSKIGITGGNERIDVERQLLQGKCSNDELSKMY